MNHAVLIAKLRWTLFKNSLRRRANLFEFIMAALAFGAFSLFDVGVSVGLGALTTVTYHHDFFAPLFAVVLGGILIVWQLMPLFTASFGSDLNISRFRIYPLTTRSLFFIDLMLGFFDPVALLATILVAGVFAGVVVASPRSAPVAGLGLLLFVLFNIGLARYIQRLLASLFASRRRKELLALFIFLLLLAPQTLIMMQRRPIERGGGPRDTTGVRYVRLHEAEEEQRVRDLRAAGEAIRWTPPGLAAAMLNPAGLDAATQFLLLLAGFIFAAAVFGLKYRQLTRDYLGHESGFSRRKKRRSDLTRESARRSTS
ncbi:MAG TPA: hypothetical protein VEZ90_14180, partial [Blastocatellia bacterium]|nr:hypothetical protein [Blastocatellia bacterium]